MVDLVKKTTPGLVAVRIAPYRTVSGIALQGGLIATAHHSLRREDSVRVQAADGSEAKASILGRDPSVDLAILKAEDIAARPLEAVADPASLSAGMLAGVIGLTIDVGPSASLGILGAVGGARRTWRGGTLESFLRLDVNLYPSQSGAAVVDVTGRLVGMATAGLLRHSGVAVPYATLERVSQEILKEGRIRHGYLGVGVQPVNIPATLQDKLPQPHESGLILVSVEPDSPAEKAGLQLGDILLSLGDASLSDVDDLQVALRTNVVGVSLEAAVLRGGEPMKVSVMVGERARKG